MQVRYVVGLILMIAAIPLQMYLVKYIGDFKHLVSHVVVKSVPEVLQVLSDSSAAFTGAASDFLQDLSDYYFDWLQSPTKDTNPTEEEGEVPEEFIHNFRPPHLVFRIGDVILTRSLVIGVIIGWDIDKSDLTKEPEYYMLVENIDKAVKEKQNHMFILQDIQVRLVLSQENRDKVSEMMKIRHDDIDKYFDRFDGLRYKPKKWLKKIYPKD